MNCYNCGAEWVTEKRVKEPGVKETCESCGAYLHCCKNCRFYDRTAYNQCTNPSAEWVSNKESGNFCGEFVFATEQSKKEQAERDTNDDALDALLGKARPEEEPSDEERLERFKKLFEE